MGVLKRGKRWWIDFSYRKQRYRYPSLVNTREGAKNLEAKIKNEIVTYGEAKSFVPKNSNKSVPTLAEFLPRWMENYVSVNNRPKEQKLKAGIMKIHFLPFFGKSKLDEITVERIDQYKRKKVLEGLHPKTINNHLHVIHKCLVTAQEWSLIESVPAMKQLKVPESNIRYLKPEETKKLLSVIPQGWWRTMILLFLRTGLRFAEASELQWEDIDFAQNEIIVSRSSVEGKIGSPKNGRTRRVKIAKDLRPALEALRAENAIGYLFVLHGKPILYKTARLRLKEYCRKAGIPDVTIHELRHTFASNLTAHGTPLPYVQRLLGHADLKMTSRYVHEDSSDLQHAVDRLAPTE
jgi:integrase